MLGPLWHKLAVYCPRKAVKFNHSLTHSLITWPHFDVVWNYQFYPCHSWLLHWHWRPSAIEAIMNIMGKYILWVDPLRTVSITQTKEIKQKVHICYGMYCNYLDWPRDVIAWISWHVFPSWGKYLLLQGKWIFTLTFLPHVSGHTSVIS